MSHRIKIITPPASHIFTTLDAVKLQLGLTNTNFDALLTVFITSASAVIESYLGRPILEQTVQETWRQMSWKARDTLVTSYSPIVSVTSVTENGVTLTVDTDFEVEVPTGVFYRIGDGFRLRWGHDVIIQYVTGYASVPAVIAQICLDLVSVAYYSSNRDPNIQLDLTEGVGRTAYFNRGVTAFSLDDGMRLSLLPFQAIIP